MNVTFRRSIAAAAVALAATSLSSCGFNAPTDQVYTPGVGVNDRSGTVDVLHALVVSGEDGSGTVIAGLVNNDLENDDALTGVTGAGDDATIEVADSGDRVEIPSAELYQLAEEGNISVTGSQVRPGQFIELTFAFENAASITVEVPVVSSDNEDFVDVPLPSDA